VASSCEHGNETSSSVKAGELLDQLSDRQLLKTLLRGVSCSLSLSDVLKMAVFWVVASCSLVELYQRFRGPCCLHHQGDLHTHRRENLKSYLI
jgi:hypothetical protein